MIPFAHTDLDVKKSLIGRARQYFAEINDGEASLEKQLSAALLYMNIADYLAEYVLLSLAEMSRIAMEKYYLGIVTIKNDRTDKLNLERSMEGLKKFDFPQKDSMMTVLGHIKKARNEIAHKMLKTDRDKLEDIDQAARDLEKYTEELITITDSINAGMPPTNLIDKLEEHLKEDPSLEEFIEDEKKPKKKGK